MVFSSRSAVCGTSTEASKKVKPKSMSPHQVCKLSAKEFRASLNSPLAPNGSWTFWPRALRSQVHHVFIGNRSNIVAQSLTSTSKRSGKMACRNLAVSGKKVSPQVQKNCGLLYEIRSPRLYVRMSASLGQVNSQFDKNSSNVTNLQKECDVFWLLYIIAS